MCGVTGQQNPALAPTICDDGVERVHEPPLHLHLICVDKPEMSLCTVASDSKCCLSSSSVRANSNRWCPPGWGR